MRIIDNNRKNRLTPDLIAAMHFNENFGRPQAITKSGNEPDHRCFPNPASGRMHNKVCDYLPSLHYWFTLVK